MKRTAVRKNTVFVDSFSSLDEIPVRLEDGHEGRVAILRAIDLAGGRYSTFDATRSQRMARTMDWLESASGWLKRKDEQPPFPWIEVEITPIGRSVLECNPPQPRRRRHGRGAK